jgi:hypothetical protein
MLLCVQEWELAHQDYFTFGESHTSHALHLARCVLQHLCLTSSVVWHVTTHHTCCVQNGTARLMNSNAVTCSADMKKLAPLLVLAYHVSLLLALFAP